ncbi:hypothetical protein C265_15457 [Cupriavidus sp. GA3-3]|nr:hypothetical protein C265_15457 [Cupriavidus sp. GA3-3]
MGQLLRWIVEEYRGMYVHATAFKVQVSDDVGAPEQMWRYIVAIGRNADHTDWECGPEADFASYLTREAAEQAGLEIGKRVIDVIQDLG